jgi:lysosomal acid lipase/cholesteryl ester hydrolase
LRLFRVNLSKSEQAKLPGKWQGNVGKVVLIVHGLSDSSDSWFYNGEGESIGFKMVEEGYDVWLGNNRGNKYSHRHVNPNISDADFFDYS